MSKRARMTANEVVERRDEACDESDEDFDDFDDPDERIMEGSDDEFSNLEDDGKDELEDSAAPSATVPPGV